MHNSGSARVPRAHFRVAAWLATLVGGAPVAAAAHEIELASIEQARAVLGARDDFVARLSPFDRAARLRSGGEVSEDEYLAATRAAAREWSNDERARLAAAFMAVEPKLAALLPELDEPILLVKTSGEEEGGAGYTRGSAVMLPQAMTDAADLQRTLAHEIFHVVSRNNPALKRELYAAIGFEECGEVALPPQIAARKMTNPDAPVNAHCIELTVEGTRVWAMPLLLSREERFDPAANRPFFAYLTVAMLLVDRSAGPSAARPLLRDGAPVLVPLNRVGGYLEQIGRNTNYVIHAEEVLASNFELLVSGAPDAPSPEVLERLRAVLTRAAGR
jgi:hypothetical protein